LGRRSIAITKSMMIPFYQRSSSGSQRKRKMKEIKGSLCMSFCGCVPKQSFLFCILLVLAHMMKEFRTSAMRQPHLSQIWAKKSNPRNPQSSISGGGFGGAATSKSTKNTIVESDYGIFPALEPRIQDTLVPASDGSLGPEIYQRLDQIYGFPAFNYVLEENLKISESTTSAVDMLMDRSNEERNEPVHLTNDASSMDISSDLQKLPPLSGIRVLHVDPMVLALDDFFTSSECDRYIEASTSQSPTVLKSRSPTVGKDAAAKAQRTSTTFYHPYQQVPELMSKASRLLGLTTVDRWEEPQTVRYRRNEKFTWHLDALGPLEQQASPAGQRVATLLVYLTSLEKGEGGATLFRDLRGKEADKYLRVQPKKGMALLFFPSASGIVNCPFDIRTLHCGEMVSANAVQDKWIAQLWLRQRRYTPTAPPGNRHEAATEAIGEFCRRTARA
jgi:2OG-Fe(II) oxygenase superfamily